MNGKPEVHSRLNSASLERIVPDEMRADEATGVATLQLHIERYEFAKKNLVPGSVLDIACGVGYGTALLSSNPSTTTALGVDIDHEAIQYASRKYIKPQVSYVCADALQFLAGKQFNNIVSLETIEHVPDPHALFTRFVSSLATGGRLIASVPITPSVDANPHHKSNFSARSFRRLGEEFSLKYLTCFEQEQRFSPWRIATRQEVRAHNMRRGMAQFYLSHPSHFCLRLWSTLRDGFVNKYLTIAWQK